MADLAAEGAISQVLVDLRTLIAGISWFQTWVGHAGDSSEAEKHILIGEIGDDITAYSRTSDVVTIETSQPHGLEVGDEITVQQLHADVNGTYTVASVPSDITLTFSKSGDDISERHPELAGFLLPIHRPCVYLYEDDENTLSDIQIGVNTYIQNGDVGLFLEADVSALYQDDERNARIEMLNAFAKFRDELRGVDSDDFHSMQTTVSPAFAEHANQSDGTKKFERWAAEMQLSWGLQA